MNQQERPHNQRPPDDRHDDPKNTRTTDTGRRHNPRLVFADPDKFFRDLLMEQQEQG